MKLRIFGFTIYFLIIISSVSFCANHYIRSGATGENTGADWTNAWTDLPTLFIRGDTYYIADGIYGEHTFDTIKSGTLVITIKKATINNHGTESGWNSSYGDGQALFTGDPVGVSGIINFNTDYWVFDGQIRDESDWSYSDAYGFAIHINEESLNDNKNINIKNGADHITVKYCDVKQAGMYTNLRQDCVYAVSSSDNGSSYLTFSRCFFHDSNRTFFLFGYVTDWIVEYSAMTRLDDASVPTIHREPFSINNGGLDANGVVRYNDIWNIPGDRESCATGIVVIKDAEQGGYEIYGNTISDCYVSNGIVTTTIGDILNNTVVYNNSFYNMNGLSSTAVGITVYNGSGNIAKNNVWYNCLHTPSFTNILHDFNACDDNIQEANQVYLNSDPFLSSHLGIFTPLSTSQLINRADITVPILYRTDRNGIVHDEIGALSNADGSLSTIPVISSVTISPDQGTLKVGDSISIKVKEALGRDGLVSSDALINDKYIPLSNIGSGIYQGTYVIQSGDENGVNVEATNITLRNEYGSSSIRSSSGSSLCIDATIPSIKSVTLTPNSGTLYPGNSVTITVTAENEESGLSPSTATFLGHKVQLNDIGSGLYSGTYTIQTTDTLSGMIAQDALIVDDFEDYALPNWDYVGDGVFISDESKISNKAVAYTINSTNQNYMNAILSKSYDDLYTSFYFKIDQLFSMIDNNIMYVNFVRSNESYPWALRLRKSNNQFQLNVTYDAYITDVGEWITIVPGEWYWVKVHFRSNTDGVLEWWLDGINCGHLYCDTSGKAIDKVYGVALDSIDQGTGGNIYWDYFQVAPSDHIEPSSVEATAITLCDAAGNMSKSVSTSGSSLTIDTSQSASIPSIDSVSIIPNHGYVGIDSIITVIVNAANYQAGLIPSTANINGKQITLYDKGNGTYSGQYIVQSGDNDAFNVEATDITLSNSFNTSTTAASIGSSLNIDANAPIIENVTIYPNTGTVTLGDSIYVEIKEKNNEPNLIPAGAMINSTPITFVNSNGGTYLGYYVVENDHNYIVNAECIDVTLTDIAGNISAKASSSGSSLIIDSIGVGINQPIVFKPELSRNYPNPFNSNTTIEYQVPDSVSGNLPVTIAVYNLSGQCIRTLINDVISPGIYHEVWDGCNDSGNKVSAGVYLFKLKTGSNTTIKKMTFLK